MSDLIRSTSTWWAQSSKHARRTAIGTTAIVLVLGLITWTVWVSPSGPVSSAVQTALGVTPKKQAAQPTAAELTAKLDAAQQRIWELEGKLESTDAQSGSRSDQITTLKAQLASLQSQLGAAKSRAEGLAGRSGAGGGGGGTSGGGSGTNGGSTASAVDHGAAAGSNGSGSTHPVGTGNGGPSRDPSPTLPAAPTKAEVLAQQARWYGLYTAQAPFNWAEYDEVQQQVGKASNMVGFFQGFDQDFNASAVQRSWANGRLPMMTWETKPLNVGNDKPNVPGYSNQDVIDGDFDAYLTKYAQAVKANGQPIVIRLDHEMNGSWYNWSEQPFNPSKVERPQNAPGTYRQMWQHVWQVFEANGANDEVIWNWSPTRIDDLGSDTYRTVDYTAKYYPGAQYVDWVGMSGYYRNAGDPATFAKTFDATLGQLRQIAPGKPIVLNEIGATESGTAVSESQKAAWFTSLFAALADPANDDVIGFAYFSEVATSVTDGKRATNDWRLNSRKDSLAAFSTGIRRDDIGYDLQEVKEQ